MKEVWRLNRKIVVCFLLPFILLGHSLFAGDSTFVKKITIGYETGMQYPLKNLTYHSPKTLKVGLVLSGGGARGFAHIGVLKALEENNIPIHLLVSTSMGSIIGGFYAAGYNAEQLAQIIKGIEWQNFFSDDNYRTNLFWAQKTNPRRHILEVRFDKGLPYIPSSINTGQKIFDIIYSRLLKANFQAANNFNNLRIPFRAVATDLVSGRKVVLSHGDLAEAISASSATPILFAPVPWEGMELVDGGVRDNLPVDVAIHENSDLTIAVDVTSPLREADQLKLPWQIADQVTTIMMREPTRESSKMADVLIRPQIGEHGAFDFSNIDSLVEGGYEATLQKIDTIKAMMQDRQHNLWGQNEYLGKVKEIKITGLQRTPLSALTQSLTTREGASLYQYDLFQDLNTFYQTGLIADAYVLLKGDPSAYTVEFHLKENPIVRQVEFHTRHLLPDSVLNNSFKLPLNETLNYNLLFPNLDSLRQVFVNAGYSLARFLAIQYDSAGQRLDIDIDEGVIGNVIVEGNRKTRNFVILREFPLKKGRIFNAERAVAGIRNIYSTGLFDKVTVNVVRKDSVNDLIVKVIEKKFFLMRLGAYASMERKGKAFLEFAEDNLLGREVKTSLFGEVGELERGAELKLYSVRLFRTLLTYRFSLQYNERWDRYYQDFVRSGNYQTIRRGAQFVLGQQIERLGSISAEIRWDGVSVYSGDPVFPYRDSYRIRSLTVRSVVDKRDKLPFPDKGIYNRWFWETGNQRLLGSSKAFTRFYIALEGYYPVWRNFNYHIMVEGGSADLTLPFSEFFTMGGMLDFPGLYDREKFGRQIIHLSTEIRHNFHALLPFDLYAGVNFNVGATWKTSEETIRRSDFLTSWGGYLAVNSIFGPIRFAYGHLVGIRDLLYFSIGYNF